jgi:hypothetical protein
MRQGRAFSHRLQGVLALGELPTFIALELGTWGGRAVGGVVDKHGGDVLDSIESTGTPLTPPIGFP